MSLIRILIPVLSVSLMAGVAVAKSKNHTKLKYDLATGAPLELTFKMDELSVCSHSKCMLGIADGYDVDAAGGVEIEGSYLMEIDGAGSWVLFAPNEHYSKKAKDDDGNILLCKDHTAETKVAAEEAEDDDDETDDAPPAEAPAADDSEASAPTGSDFAHGAEGDDAEPAPKAAEGGDGEEAEKPDDAEEEEDDSWKELPVLSVEERRANQHDRNVKKSFCIEAAKGTLAGDGNERILELANEFLPDHDFVLYTNGFFGAYLEGVQIGSPKMTGGIKINR